ncbi:M23 family metallopeptidase [Paenibacillus tarimensis]|uniref:M23 family metallopeptidase n=1 Tax=Paenibacillus tarimensis TaxID=416012 RepID=UPI001F439BED|nr:M23 family metallopeptidase [Paenibacillus tarimensis]MCF2943957.1 M23 family metallopeptidase [Paenibacillus tarimensis]
MAERTRVKQRREERIRELMERSLNEHSTLGYGEVMDTSMAPPSVEQRIQPDKHEQVHRTGVSAQPAGGERDPEIEWKRRSEDWLKGGGRLSKLSLPESPVPSSDFEDPTRYGKSWGGMRVKLVISLFIFGAVWGLFSLKPSGTEDIQRFVLSALTEELDTEAAAEWYKKTFAGAPSFIPIFDRTVTEAKRVDGSVAQPAVLPIIDGTVVRSFAETLNGVEIAGRPGSEITVIETGRVGLVSGNEADGYSIVVQHADNRTSIYGRLRETSVEAGDWVEAGERLGWLNDTPDGDSLLYFAVRVDGRYVDPTDVVPLD